MPLTLTLQSFVRPEASALIHAVTTSSNGTISNNHNFYTTISHNNRYVFFVSSASNLVTDDTNGGYDLFRKDLVTGETIRVSTATGGVEADGLGFFTYSSVSADGRYAIFSSTAANLVAGDTNGNADIFRKDLLTGETIRLSTFTGGAQADGNSTDITSASMTADGRYVVFGSGAINLVAGDTNGRNDIFLKDLITGVTTRISTSLTGAEANHTSAQPSISANGRYVVFHSLASNLVDGDTSNTKSDVFRKDLVTGEIIRVSTAVGGISGNAASTDAQISADGRYVVFESIASNLVLGDTNGKKDIFRKDLATGDMVRISAKSDGSQLSAESRDPKMSADGRYVVFELVGGDSVGQGIFRKDLVTGELVKISGPASGMPADSDGFYGNISADGRFVVFGTLANNAAYGDNNGFYDNYVVDTAPTADQVARREGRVVELKFGTGAASTVSLNWGDGAISTVTPVNGNASFSHTYASTGIKSAVATIYEGGSSRVISYFINVSTGQLSRNSSVADKINGSAAGDNLAGDGEMNIIFGHAGRDILDGGWGNDTIYGGADNDAMIGGAGHDVFVFDTRLGTSRTDRRVNFDTLRDFNRTDDSIYLDNAFFAKIGRSGSIDNPVKMNKAYFKVGAEAADRNDYILYNNRTGVLSYDRDGSGRADPVEFAIISNKARLTADDFFVI
jgi:Ca2+-binding RTX toxin-like protein